jgi:hypothetical protein
MLSVMGKDAHFRERGPAFLGAVVLILALYPRACCMRYEFIFHVDELKNGTCRRQYVVVRSNGDCRFVIERLICCAVVVTFASSDIELQAEKST